MVNGGMVSGEIPMKTGHRCALEHLEKIVSEIEYCESRYEDFDDAKHLQAAKSHLVVLISNITDKENAAP